MNSYLRLKLQGQVAGSFFYRIAKPDHGMILAVRLQILNGFFQVAQGFAYLF
jgi:hypothetical protein